MNRLAHFLAALLILSVIAVVPSQAQQPVPRFRPLQVYIDSGERPLAAYQVEIIVTSGNAEVVGVEGGNSPGFRAAPYYDPAALKGGRIIIAAFTTGSDLPSGKIRVATVHVQETGTGEPQYNAKLMVAAGADGKPITASVSVTPDDGRPRSQQEDRQ